MVWKDGRGYAGVVDVKKRWKDFAIANFEQLNIDGIDSLSLMTCQVSDFIEEISGRHAWNCKLVNFESQLSTKWRKASQFGY